MRFTTLSAIMRGTWLLEPQWAEQHLAVVVKLLSGENVDLGTQAPPAPDDSKLIQLSTRGYKVRGTWQVSSIPEGSVAVVDLVGPVVRYGDMCTSGLEDKANLLRSLDNAGNIVGVVLNINSPGGEASGTAMGASVIKNMKKPIIGLVDDGIAASAGFWLFSACRERYVTNAQCSVGSIGAYQTLANWYGYYKSQGLDVFDIYAPQSTEKNKEYREALAGDTTGVEARLFDLVEFFIADVKANLGSNLNLKAGDPFKGAMYKTSEAKKLGLINGIKSMEEAIARVQQLAKQQSSQQKSNNMAKTKSYANIATTAGWPADHASDEDGGLYLNQEESAAVDSALATGATNAQKVVDLEANTQTQNERITTLEKELETANTSAKDWQEKAEKYGAKSANKGTNTIVEKDQQQETTAKEVHPFTTQAQALFAKKQQKS